MFTLLMLIFLLPKADASTFYEQLCAFNDNWERHAFQAPTGEARLFKTDQDYVQAHLSQVIHILRNNLIDHLSETELRSRIQLLAVLDQYRILGEFPINYYRPKRIPVFIDEHGTHCAVGYLLMQSGHSHLAKEISKLDNYAWIKNIHHPGFSVWQQASGFSLEELKLIQGAYEFYIPNALQLANRYEIPQKPAVMTLYFNQKGKNRKGKNKQENIWCYGEGENGVLNGAWIQNFATGVSWIEGYFNNGNRTGQWKEYYQGTNQLCRTENWRNDQLNGVRKRFDRSGKLIEEILFKNGKAITKINYDFTNSLKWVRQPIDGVLMDTEVYTFGGALTAYGKEKVHNPGNLLWFQNIELTALNSAAITSRNIATSTEAFGGGRQVRLFSSPPLVKYKKEGKWVYYKEATINSLAQKRPMSIEEMLSRDYTHFGEVLFQSIQMFADLKADSGYDSI